MVHFQDLSFQNYSDEGKMQGVSTCFSYNIITFLQKNARDKRYFIAKDYKKDLIEKNIKKYLTFGRKGSIIKETENQNEADL